MKVFNNKTKKIIAAFLAVMLIVTGAEFASVFANMKDTNSDVLLGNSDVALGESQDNDVVDGDSEISLGASGENDSRIKFIAAPQGSLDAIYSYSEFQLSVSAPTGDITIELEPDMQYAKDMTEKAYEKLIDTQEIEKIEDLIEYDEEARKLTLHFADKKIDLGSIEADEDGFSGISTIADNKEDVYIPLFLTPSAPKVHKITAKHSDNYSNYVEVPAKRNNVFLANSAGFLSYDGKDAFTTTSWGNYAIVPYTGLTTIDGAFHQVTRTAQVNAAFSSDSSHTNKRVEIKIGKGLQIYSAPGLKPSGTSNLWAEDLAGLPEEIKAFVSKVEFTRNTDVQEYNKDAGGTIVYHLHDGAVNIPLTVQLLGQGVNLNSGSAFSNGTPSMWGGKAELIDLVDAIQAKTTYEDRASQGTSIEIASGKVDSIKIYGGLVYMFSGSHTGYYVTSGVQFNITPSFVKTGSVNDASFTSATLKYLVPIGFTIDEVNARAAVPKNVSYNVTSHNATHNLLTITMDEGYLGTGLTIKTTPDAAMTPGNYVISLYDGDIKYPLVRLGKLVHGDAGSQMRITVTEPTLDKLQHTSLTIQKIRKNNSPSNYNYPLGGFALKNMYGEAITNQRIKFVFEDVNMSVTAVKLYSATAKFNDVKIITRERGADNPIIVGDITHGVTVLARTLKGFDATVSSTDSIAEISYQMPSLAVGGTIGYEGPVQTPFINMSYYGRISSSLGDGSSFTAELQTTTGDDPDFIGVGGAATPGIDGVQKSTVTTQVTTTEPGGLLVAATAGSTNSAHARTAGEDITLRGTYTVNTSRTYYPAIYNVGYVKGYNFYLKKLPYVDYQTGSFRVWDMGKGTQYNVSAPTELAGSNGEILVFSVPDLVFADSIGTGNGNFAVEAKYSIAKNAPYLSYEMSDYLSGFPMDDTIKNVNGYDGNMVRKDTFDNNLNGDKTELALSYGNATILNITAKSPFSLSTAARLNAKDSEGNTVIGDWGFYDAATQDGRIVLNPDGEADFGFFMSNDSEDSLTKIISYIPLPKVGGVVDVNLMPASPANYDPSTHIQQAPFEWDVLLGGEAKISGSFTDVDVFYSLSYEKDESNISAWKTWGTLAEADRKSVKTVIIKARSAAEKGSTLQAVVPLAFDKTTADNFAGKINTYSAYVDRKLVAGSGSISEGAIPSEPVSIVLKTGVIAGYVFNDLNANGQKDAGDTGLYNFEVNAYEAGTTKLIDTANTDAAGFYRFNGLDKDQDVDIVFDRRTDNPGWKFTAGAAVSVDGDTASWNSLTPSEGNYAAVNAGLSEPYTLNFDLNSGDGTAPASIVKYHTETVGTVPPDPTKANYDFQGWFTADSGGTKVMLTAGATINSVFATAGASTRTQTLYAQWNVRTAAIKTEHYTYADDIATATRIVAHDKNETINHGQSFTAAKVVIPGYAFVSANPSETIIVDGDVTIKMYYQAGMKTVDVEHYTYTTSTASAVKVDTTTHQGRVDQQVVIAKETFAGQTYNSALPALAADMKYTVLAGTNLIKLYYKTDSHTIKTEHYTFNDDIAAATHSSAQDKSDSIYYGTQFTAAKVVVPGYAFVSANPSETITVNGDATIKMYYQAGMKTVDVEHYTYTTSTASAVKVDTTTHQGRVDQQVVIAKGTFAGQTYNSALPALAADMKYTVLAGTNLIKLYYKTDSHTIKTEHYTFNDDIAAATHLSAQDKSDSIYYGTQFTATKVVVPGYAFVSANPSETITVNGDVTIKMYYQAGMKTVDVEHYTYTTSTASAVKVDTTTHQGRVDQQVVIAKETITGHTYDHAAPVLLADMKYTVLSGSNIVKVYYKANSYEVEYNTDNGAANAKENLQFGTVITKPAIPVKTGHTFAGAWNKPDGSVWNFATDTVPVGGIILTAQYTINSYDVTFIVNGGTKLQTGQDVVTYNFNKIITEPTTTRPGYTLEGWFNGTAKWKFDTDKMPANNFTLTAKWTVDTAKTVTYTFDLQGGKYNGSTTNPTQVKNAGSTLTEYTASEVKRTGMVVQGWYTEPTFVSQWIFSTTLEHDLFVNTTLYAKWIADSANPMSVTFDLTGGNHSGSTSIGIQRIMVGGSVTKPAGAMDKLGHTFGAWYNGTAKWDFSTVIDSNNFGDMTLTAKWTPNKYKVSFDADNGSVTYSDDYVYNTTINAPVQPTKIGYTFEGWYNGAAKWDFALSKVPANNITLTARWTISSFTLSIDADNGTAITKQQIPYMSTATDPGKPVKTGHTFAGWYNEAVEWDFAGSTMPAKNLTIKAKWNVNSYTITVKHYTYSDSIGSGELKDSKTYNANYFTDFTATKSSFTYHAFIAKDSDPVSFKVEGDKTVNLYYKADKYTINVAKSQLELRVNDKYPVAAVNKPSWDDVVGMIGVTTINSNAAEQITRAGAPSPIIDSPDYTDTDFSTISNGFDKFFTVNAVWPNGDTDSVVIKLKTSDTKAPEILNLVDDRRFLFEKDKSGIQSEADLLKMLKENEISALDNYDGVTQVTISYPDPKGFASIDTNTRGEYGIYIDTIDSSGNSTRKAAVIRIYKDSTGGGTSKPDVGTHPGNENAGDGGNLAGGGAGTDGNGDYGLTGEYSLSKGAMAFWQESRNLIDRVGEKDETWIIRHTDPKNPTKNNGTRSKVIAVPGEYLEMPSYVINTLREQSAHRLQLNVGDYIWYLDSNAAWTNSGRTNYPIGVKASNNAKISAILGKNIKNQQLTFGFLDGWNTMAHLGVKITNANLQGEQLYMYYYNSYTGELEFVGDMEDIGSNWHSVSVKGHYGEYVITDQLLLNVKAVNMTVADNPSTGGYSYIVKYTHDLLDSGAIALPTSQQVEIVSVSEQSVSLNLWIFIVVAAAGFAAVAGIIYLHKKRKEQDEQ